jgi:hypothetical protein
MFKYKIFLLMSVFTIFFYVHLYGDIIVTNDEMILNGKIIEDKKDDYIKFANYHGTFHIEYKQIREIFRTKSFEEDVKIFRDKGKSIDEKEVKTNYQAGLEKLGQQKIDKEKAAEIKESSEYAFFFSAFYSRNFGKIGSILYNSMDFSAACDIPMDQLGIIKMLYIAGIRGEIEYFYSKNDAKGITGYRAMAGPLWQIPVIIGKIPFKYCISPAFGIGRYSATGISNSAAGIKFNTSITTGPFFKISSIMIGPQLKFDYIYDSIAPLYRIGFGIDAGFCF